MVAQAVQAANLVVAVAVQAGTTIQNIRAQVVVVLFE